ncbi:MAG TPA: carboxypeptidase regulatory-like domain-containing protein [Bryobacteraceae bacterium]
MAIAEIDGYVTDPSGQAIAGAQVKATEVDKGQVRNTVSDMTGRYALPDLPVGSYKLEVSAAGFKAYVQTGIILQVANNVTLNVPMQIGAVTESIRVEANAAMVETKENAVAQVINAQSMIDLPLNGRNPTQLLTLTGAGTSTMTLNGGDLTGSKNIQGSNASGQFSVAGSQANGINFLLDGGDNNDSFSNVNLPIPVPDFIEEFNVQTNGLPAQYGLHPGGVVNIVTKSGTNAFHGDLFDFLRNGDLNARPEGAATTQGKRDSLKRNQFGGTAGGRIIKDKLFFFGGYQGTRQRSDPSQSTAYVPTAAVLQGNFSVIDAAKTAGGCLAKAVQLKSPSGVAYPGNLIPVSTFDAAGFKLASTYLPVSPQACGAVQYGYLADNPDDQWIGRIDYILSDKHSMYGRYYIYDYLGEVLFDGSNALTTGTSGNKDRAETATYGDTYTLNPTQVNSFHATFDRRRDDRADASNMFSPGTLGVNMWEALPDYTQLTVSGYSGGGFAVGCGTCALATFNVNTYQLSDDFTYIHGRHQFMFGFDGRKDQFNSVNNQQANGQFTFNGGTSGDGMADLLLGRFSGLTDGKVISDYIRLTAIAAYAQDAFHATPRLTINYGVRWEPEVPAYDKYGRGNQFNLGLFEQGWHSSVYPQAPAGLVFSGDSAQDPYGKAFTASHWATFSPRLGIVWDPKGDGKQTLRAAFTLMHDTAELFYPERWTTNSPYVSSLTLSSGQFSNPFGSYTSNGVTGDPFPGNIVFPAAGTYISVPPDVKPTYVMQWNLSYQRQLAPDWLVTANYLGNASRHIWGSVDINYSIDVPVNGVAASTSNTAQRRLLYLMNPASNAGAAYGEIQVTDDGANAEYHALLVSVQHRLSHNVSFLSNYTFSHCISDWDFAGELAGVIYQNPTNRDGERGNCGFDHRQVFNTSLVVTSPGLGHSAAKMITKNWQLSPIVSLFTGNPIELSDGGKDISLSAQLLDRPENIAPNNVYAGGISNAGNGFTWFNPLSFAYQAAGTFGDTGRNSIYGPGAINWDMAVSRRFEVKERWKMDIRADFFNILNHANWGNPGTSIASSGTFGQITSFGTPRQIQMAVKLFF